MEVMDFIGAKPIRGFVNLYVFDENENVIEEVHKENNLTNRGIQIMMLNCLKNKDSFDSNCFNLTNFGTLYVMNYTQDIDDVRKMTDIKGDIIGWANAQTLISTYNNKQGTIDVLSSGVDLSKGEINLFIKFGYEKCLGTFNHLMWGTQHAVPDSVYNSPEGLAYAPKFYERVNITGGSWNTVCDNRGYMYCIKNDRKVYRLNWTMGGNRKRLEPAETGVALQIPIDDYIHYALFNAITNTFWVWTDMGIYHFTLDWDFIEKKEHLVDDTITQYSSWDLYKGCCYAFWGEYVFGYREGADYSRPEPVIDIWRYDGTKISTQEGLFSNSDRVFTIFTDNKYVYCHHNIINEAYTAITVLKFNETTKAFDFVCRNVHPNMGGRNWTYTYKRPLDHTFLVVDDNSTYAYLANAIHNPGAVLKLPTTYTKGTGNMMIVHYQFKM